MIIENTFFEKEKKDKQTVVKNYGVFVSQEILTMIKLCIAL